MVDYAVVKRFIRRLRRHTVVMKEIAEAVIEIRTLLTVILDLLKDPPW